MTKPNRKIVFEDGTEYYGIGFGSNNETITEAVFNTAMVGYQEIVTDAAYAYQTVVMTYPVIGNYGMADEDYENENVLLGGLIVRYYNDQPVGFRCEGTLAEFMEKNGIPGVYGVDTRKIARSLRDNGTQKVMITDINTPTEEAVAKIKAYELPSDAVKKVSCTEAYKKEIENPNYKVVAVDCGIKASELAKLNEIGCSVTVVPYNTDAAAVACLNPDGVYISDGPGNPENLPEVVALAHEIAGKYPVMGVGLGCQVVSLGFGAKTYKLKAGHRGANHPVKNLSTGKKQVVSQNHSYAVCAESLKETDLEISHVNLLDGSAEGVYSRKGKVIAVQFQPETLLGPDGTPSVYDTFTAMMEDNKNA